MYVSAIVLAAGKGKRLKSKISKPLVYIGAKPIIYYCLKVLSRHALIRDIVVVINKYNKNSIEKQILKFGFSKITKIVIGGKLRQDSVLRGISALDTKTELVLIHDSVRPFITKEMVTRVIEAAKKRGAAIVAVPSKSTIKRVALSLARPARALGPKVISVKETLKRNELWEAQTPQVFKKDLILRAYRRFSHQAVTDDSSFVEKLGSRPSVIMGSYENIKITTPEDLTIAQAILKAKKKLKHN